MSRKIRYGMVGGGRGAFIGAVHRIAAALDQQIELVCGAFSSDAAKSKASGADLFLPASRCYGSFEEMIKSEAALPADQRMDFVAIVTPNHMHFPPAKLALESGFHVLSDKPAITIPSYASMFGYGEPELTAQNVAEAVSKGYTRVKLHEQGAAAAKATRQAVGMEIELTLDSNCRWEPEKALDHVRSLEPFDLTFVEEPVWPPEDYVRYGEVSRGTKIAIAAGENLTVLSDFERLIDVGGVRYVQPSVTKVGGITEMIKIIKLCNDRGVTAAPHSPYFGPGLIASAHICASLAPDAALEQMYCTLDGLPFESEVFSQTGSVQIPVGPGLGVEPNEEIIARYRVA